MDLMVLAARTVLAAVFAVAGVAKLADRKGTRALALDVGVPTALAGPLEWLLPLAELVCAVMLIPAATATAGALATLAMLVVFIAGITVSLARGRRPDCHCFGQMHSKPVGWNTVARNGVLSALAVFVILQGDAGGQPGFADTGRALLGSNDARGVVAWPWVVLLGIVGLVAAAALAMTYQLLKQNGRLALRLEALEARFGVDVPQEPGLAVATTAPAVPGEDLSQGLVLLFFKTQGCGPCEAMLPEVAAWRRDHQDRLRIVIIDDKAVADAYLVTATPGAVLIDHGTVASPLAQGREAIRALVVKATLPPPYTQGDLVSPLTLIDIDGNTVDVAQLIGRQTVLLFWNPACGFCLDALDDVKWWEQHRDPQLADLVVIASGDADSNRAQGFRSRVLLDDHFVAGNRFGATGTPSAVIVDARGRVASAVAVGAPEVLALAGSASPARG